MQLISIIPGFQPKNDRRLLEKAAALTPALHYTPCPAPAACRVNGEEIPPEALAEKPLRRGDQAVLDFGRHIVGRLTLSLDQTGSFQDAPAFIRLDFAEIPGELAEDPMKYSGWISSSWIQREEVHIDVLPAQLSLPRRYAFRYVRLTVLDTSPKYSLLVRGASCVGESSAGESVVPAPVFPDGELARIYSASLRTLAECTQRVLEDGPKRDRRLWLGDLRLQALTSYVSFRSLPLIKRCLYLFAGSRFPDGRMSANVFTDREPAADDTYLTDYALLAVPALLEYLEETDDAEAAEDLMEPVLFQADYALDHFLTADGTVTPEAADTSFIDWSDGLDRRTAVQGIFIQALDAAASLCARAGDGERSEKYRDKAEALRASARRLLWSDEQGCFLSGDQVSVHSQAFMTLAGVIPREKAAEALSRAASLPGAPRMVTPYMHHYYVMALLKAGQRGQAEKHLREYWGGMLRTGSDTFWESWDPADPDGSPYGGRIVNSYCHAWSCTPAYIISRYLLSSPDDQQ